MATNRIKRRTAAGKDPTFNWDNIKEYPAVWEASLKIVGSNEQKLKWIFEFIDIDLKTMSDKDQRVYGECLRRLAGGYQPTEGTTRFLVGEELGEYQKLISEGMRALFDDRWRRWTISPPKEIELWRMSPITSRGAGFQFILRGDERSGILYGVLELLKSLPGRVRACGFCHKPILRSKRQEYCSAECSRAQREKNRREGRERARLRALLMKFNVVGQLPGDTTSAKQVLAKELLAKLNSAASMDEFWKAVHNGAEVVLKRFLATKGRKPKSFR